MPDEPENYRKPMLHVSHADLERADENSPFRSMCPACKKGTLLVRRDQKSFTIVNLDICTLCGQQIIYTDEIIGGEPVTNVIPQPRPPAAPGDGGRALDKVDSALGD